jgi:hypothetical protein
MSCRVVRWKSTDVSEEHVASIFEGRRISQARNQCKPGSHRRLSCSSEKSVDFQRTTPRYAYIPEDRTLHNHRCTSISTGKYVRSVEECGSRSDVQGENETQFMWAYLLGCVVLPRTAHGHICNRSSAGFINSLPWPSRQIMALYSALLIMLTLWSMKTR